MAHSKYGNHGKQLKMVQIGLIFILNTVSFLEPLAQIHKEWDTVMW